MAEQRIPDFEAFWPFYLREHAKRETRTWHFVGSSLGLVVAAGVIAAGVPYLMPLGLLPGYGCAWYSHFFIEGNRPASFKYPLWSFIADWKMWSLILTGKIDEQVARHVHAANV